MHVSDDIQKQMELRSDRESVASFTVGFLKAFQQAVLPHQSLVSTNAPPELISCSLAHLQVFSVRALETFFRDCFVLLCKRDPSFLAKATEATKGKIDYATLSSFVSGKASLEDHLAAQRNFQNLDVINLAFEPLFGRSTFEALNEATFHPLVPGDPPRTVKLNLKEKPWESHLYELFSARHQIIHNANRPLPSDQVTVLEQADMALLVGQLFGSHLAAKLQVGTIATEAPLWMVVLTGVAGRSKLSPEVLIGRMAKALASNRELADARGHIGPAIVLGQHLMRLRFADSHPTNDAIVDGRDVVHLLTQEDDHLVLQTLQGVHGDGVPEGNGVTEGNAEGTEGNGVRSCNPACNPSE
jgi:hypothetical protein